LRRAHHYSGGWAIYVLPIVFFLLGLSQLKCRTEALLSLSKGDFAKLAPWDLAVSNL